MDWMHTLCRFLPTPCLLAVLLASGVQAQVSFCPMGTTVAGEPIIPDALSANGLVVAGRALGASTATTSGDRPVLWTASGGVQELAPVFGLQRPYVRAISGDGSTIAVDGDGHAYTWSAAHGRREFLPLSGDVDVLMQGMSHDGSIVQGASYRLGRGYHSVIWRPDGTSTDLSTTANPSVGPVGEVQPWGLSADGSVATGWYNPSNSPGSAPYRWTPSGGMVPLPMLGQLYGAAAGISPDGNVCVGYSSGPGGASAVRWIGDSMVEDLGSFPGADLSIAFLASTGGEVIVGEYDGPAASFRPWIWTRSTGMLDLSAFLSSSGVDLTGWSLIASPRGLSADGNTLVGIGTHEYAPGLFRTEGWMATIPSPAPWMLFGAAAICSRAVRRPIRS
ncbi:MAG TPA: hypothetical protein PKE29_03825 [Phycisphaerales bacterium]|nr:hypothetical protein [Phycisphaerales bacterium]